MSEEMKLKGSDQELKLLEVACNGCECLCRSEIAEVIRDQIAENRENRSWGWRKENSKLRFALAFPPVFNQVVAKAYFQSKQALLDSGKVSEFGDGEFLKWFFEWLQNGGAETIIKIIAAILTLFA